MTWIDWVRDGASWLLLLGGGFFCLVGGFGIVTFPSFYQRIHAASVTDSLGAALIILGLFLQADHWMVGAKLVLLILFLWITGPTAAHALVKAAYARGLEAEIDFPAEVRDPDAPPVPEEEDSDAPDPIEGVRYGRRST